MGPLERYQHALSEPGFVYDPAQEQAITEMQRVWDALRSSRQHPLRKSLRNVFAGQRGVYWEPVRGLYMWGGVGRGKTHMMDLFFESLPFEHKERIHFHRFMQQVHRDLKAYAGQKNPLTLIAARIAERTRVICFDEFFVSDITDAMLLAGLFTSLFERGVTLVTTSNVVPDNLYKDGLQRQRFLPAIELLKTHTRVINVDGGVDHRLRLLEKAELYHCPLDAAADASLRASFDSLAPEAGQSDVGIEVEGRQLVARMLADDVVWFDFRELCDGPRSQNDYIELAREFHTVLVSNLPQLGADSDDQARRFINLVDEFYDRHVKLVISAATPIPEIYTGSRLSFEFERTMSRLLEMQSHDYLALPHRP